MPRIEIIDGHVVCSKCNISYPLANFRHQRSICLKCRHRENNDLVNRSIESYINRSVVVARSRAKSQGIIFEITTDDMLKQYESQQGKCFYSDIEMVWGYGKGKSPYSMSLDKIIPENGYVLKNSVFCCNMVNMMKSNFTLEQLEIMDPAEWVKRAKKFIS